MRTTIRSALPAPKRWAGFIWGAALIVLAAVIYAHNAAGPLAHNDWATGDEVAYLRLALEAREDHGGPLGTLLALYQGKFLEDKRHPLYPILLAPFLRHDLADFDRARLFNLWSGLATVVTLAALTWRLRGPWAGVWMAWSLALTPALPAATAIIGAEAIFVALVGATCLTSWHALSDDPSQRRWIVTALPLVALCWMGKETAPILLPPLVLALVVSEIGGRRLEAGGRKPEIGGRKPEAGDRRPEAGPTVHGPRSTVHALRFTLYALCLALLIASPLLVRNQRVYGNPFHNYSYAGTMWLDQYDESYTEEFRAQGASAAQYLRDHSPAQITERLWQGCWFKLQQMAGLMAPAPWLGGLLLALAALAALCIGNWPQRLYQITLYGGSLILFGWYVPVSPSPRFLWPLVPFLYYLLFEGLAWLVHWRRRLTERRRTKDEGRICALCGIQSRFASAIHGWPSIIAGTLAMVAALIMAAGAVRGAIPPPAQEPAPVAELRTWLEERLGADDVYVFGPDSDFTFRWYSRFRPAQQVDTMNVPDFAAFDEYASQLGVRWLVVTPRQFERRRAIFEPYIAYQEEDGFIYALGMPNWRLEGWGQDRGKVVWLVLRREENAEEEGTMLRPDLGRGPRVLLPALEVVDADFGGKIALRGYQISPAALQPGGQLTLTLDWQREAAMSTSYTVFAHLVAAGDGSLAGQVDKLPHDGELTTDRWLPAEWVRDRYVITVAASAPPGAYQIAVGLYNLQDGQRLPVIGRDGSTVGDHIILPMTITVTLP